MQTFAMAPAALRSVWFILLILIGVLVLVVGVLGLALVSSQSARFTRRKRPSGAVRAMPIVACSKARRNRSSASHAAPAPRADSPRSSSPTDEGQ